MFEEVAEQTTSGRLFHTRAAATPNARSPTVRHRARGTIRLLVADDRRRFRKLLSAALLPGTPARCDCGSGRRVRPVGI